MGAPSCASSTFKTCGLAARSRSPWPARGPRLLWGARLFLSVGPGGSIRERPGLPPAEPMTHVEALNLERLPDHLVILGGGYVGLEFAQAMRRFGSRVTIIQRGPRLLEREDPDVADALLDLTRDAGIDVFLQAEAVKVTGRSAGAVSVQLRLGATEQTLA